MPQRLWRDVTTCGATPVADGRGPRIIIAGHAFIQNIRRGHYQLGVDEAATLRVAAAFDELALAI
jgi:hypothetical protein